MKINMIMRWIQIEKSPAEVQSKAWEVLQKIKILLEIVEPKNSFSISLTPNSDEREAILGQLETKEKILKIKKLNKGTNSAFITVNKRKFATFYKKLENIISPKKVISNGLINEILCVRPKPGNKFIIVLNNDYNNYRKGDRAKLSWDLLFKIAEGEQIRYDETYKSNIDYFNSNKHNRIYTQTGYKITKIFKIEGGCIFSNIKKMSVISEKAFKRRVKKA